MKCDKNYKFVLHLVIFTLVAALLIPECKCCKWFSCKDDECKDEECCNDDECKDEECCK